MEIFRALFESVQAVSERLVMCFAAASAKSGRVNIESLMAAGSSKMNEVSAKLLGQGRPSVHISLS